MSQAICILGAAGRLGKEIHRQIMTASLCDSGIDPDINLRAWDRSLCNVIDFPDLRKALLDFQPAIIINCSAFNGMEQCEDDPALAFATNAQACAEIAAVARKLGAIFMHFSTDYTCTKDSIFPRTEKSVGEACGIYGLSKLLGEQAIRAIDCCHLIFRVSSLYGDDFAGLISPIRDLRKDITLGTIQRPIRVLKQFTTPSSVNFVARYALHALSRTIEAPREFSGVYNLVPNEPVWKSDFARYAIERFLPERQRAVITEGQLSIKRPERSVLNPEKFEMTFGVELPTVYEVFDDFAMIHGKPLTAESPEPQSSNQSSPKPE